jgi:hypothetical protein
MKEKNEKENSKYSPAEYLIYLRKIILTLFNRNQERKDSL